MRFRLTYQGDLLSSQPPKNGDPDRRGPHKHDIRRHFHRQLKQYWETHRWLKNAWMDGAHHTVLPEGPPAYLRPIHGRNGPCPPL